MLLPCTFRIAAATQENLKESSARMSLGLARTRPYRANPTAAVTPPRLLLLSEPCRVSGLKGVVLPLLQPDYGAPRPKVTRRAHTAHPTMPVEL